MTISWVTPAGSLGTITERVILEIPLTATSNVGAVTYSLISGQLPRGLKLIGNKIKGSPTEVRKLTTSRFVIRASDGRDLEDRTFSIAVDGSDAPQWLTKEGFLPVGENNTFFVLDNSFVNFQLEAYDPDVIIGDTLEFYIPPGGGELPPGLTLTKDGNIRGFTDPIFSVEYFTGSGGYDTTAFDVIALDSGPSNNNGYDSFIFDSQTYDYNELSQPPRRLSRYYSFVVVVTDGITEVRRSFRIYVVTEEFLRADNTIIQVDTGIFRADNTPDRSPIWITNSDLGRKRANNYITIFLDVYDPPSLEGTISYFLLPTNPGKYQLNGTDEIVEGNYEISGKPIMFTGFPNGVSNPTLFTVIEPETVSQLPPGTQLDSITGEIAGRVPYQPRISKTYKFTLQAVSFSRNLITASFTIKGDWESDFNYVLNDAVRFQGQLWICTEPNSNQVPTDNSIFWTRGVASSDKTFSIELVGEIESGIDWESGDDLGIIIPNQPSRLFVKATSKLYGGRVVYELVEGFLPPGLTLLSTGDIIGKTQQASINGEEGLTRIYNKVMSVTNITGTFVENEFVKGLTSGTIAKITNFKDADSFYFDFKFPATPVSNFVAGEEIVNVTITQNGSSIVEGNKKAKVSNTSLEYIGKFDFNETSFDRVFKFKIRARDAVNFAEQVKEFTITVVADTEVNFSNVYIKAFQPKSKRLTWFNFITDANIFRSADIYRFGDESFGIQPELKVLVFAGIESVEAVNFVQSVAKNHYRKRLQFGSIRKFIAKNPVTQEVEYETIVVDINDDLVKNGRSVKQEVQLYDNITSRLLVSTNQIRISSDSYLVSERDDQKVFPNSFKNMRSRIRQIGQRDRTFLPLWMRSIQEQTFVESGYINALVLCYAKPGKGDSIISRIKNSGFDFKVLDFEADRYVIDSIDGIIEDKYIAFPQRDIINKLPNPSPVFEEFEVKFGTFDSDVATFDSDLLSFDQGR